MVSIGVTAHGIHTPEERIEIAAIVPEAKLMMETLRRIAHEKNERNRRGANQRILK